MEWTCEPSREAGGIKIVVDKDKYEWPSPYAGKGYVHYWCDGDCQLNAEIPVAALEHLLRVVKAQS